MVGKYFSQGSFLQWQNPKSLLGYIYLHNDFNFTIEYMPKVLLAISDFLLKRLHVIEWHSANPCLAF